MVNCCSTTKNHDGSCLFRALSCFLDSKLKRKHSKRLKPNLKVSKSIKKHFSTFLVGKGIPPCSVITKNGFVSSFLPLMETFLNQGINVWSKKVIKITKIKSSQLQQSGVKKTEIFPLRLSYDYQSNLNIFSMPTTSDGLHHVNAISNPDVFGKKYFCSDCGHRFSWASCLIKHSFNCYKKLKTEKNTPERLIATPINVWRTQGLLDKQISFDECAIFMTLTQNQDFTLEISAMNKNELIFALKKQVLSISDAATFAMTFLSNCPDNRPQKLHENISFLAHLQTLIEKDESIFKSNSGSLNIEVIQQNVLMEIKKYVTEYLSHRQIFLIGSNDGTCPQTPFLKQILKYCVSAFPSDQISVRAHKRNISELKITGSNSGFLFIHSGSLGFTLNNGHLNTHSQAVTKFLELNDLCKKRFKVDLLSGQIKSLTGLARIHFLSSPNNLNTCLISPTKCLMNTLGNTPRFGYIHATPTSSDRQGSLKSYMALDFKKFYGQVLKNAKLLINYPMIYQKEGNYFVKKTNNLPHNAYANIFFSALESVCTGKFHYGLLAKELKTKGLPQDCLISQHPDSSNLIFLCITFWGCFHHSCDRKIHSELKHPSTCSCDICSRCPSGLKPYLWRMKPGNDLNSIHPLRKITHKENFQQSIEIAKSVAQSPHISDIKIIRECDIHFYWEKDLSLFAEHFSLPLKTGIDGKLSLKTIIVNSATNHFPLMRSHGMRKFSKIQLIEAIKTNSISGLLKISGFCEPNESLKHFEIFSEKINDKVQSSNEIKDNLVTVEFLSYLLQEPELNFYLTNVSEVYLYPNRPHATFGQQANEVLDLISSHENDDVIKKFLKNINNFFIGSLGYNPNNYQRLILMKKQDFLTTNLNQFRGSEPLNDSTCLAFFGQNSRYCNSIQNNFYIVQTARLHFLKFCVEMSRHLTCSVKSCNTDGGIWMSNRPLHLTGESPSDPARFLNQWIRPNLSDDQLMEYTSFLNTYFDINLCENHRKTYVTQLKSKQMFQPMPCCLNRHNNRLHTVLIEAAGEHCVVITKNMSIAYDEISHTVKTKSSGISGPTVERFIEMCSDDQAKTVCQKISSLQCLHRTVVKY